MRKRLDKPSWASPRAERVRVLVEDDDECTGMSVKLLLEREGYDAAWCGGPDHLRGHRCPLAMGQGCELAEGADVVVHAMNPDNDDHRSVLQALRARHPDTPIVVEVPAPRIARHADLLDGCTILPAPMTRGTVLAAVATATAQAATDEQ